MTWVVRWTDADGKACEQWCCLGCPRASLSQAEHWARRAQKMGGTDITITPAA